MFETSKDLLNIVIAISIFGIAFFLCWGMYYINMSLRQIFRGVKEMRDRIHKVDALIDSLKEKIDHSASYLFLIGEGMKKLVDIAKKYTDKKKEKEEE